jgi:hypothetical protein
MREEGAVSLAPGELAPRARPRAFIAVPGVWTDSWFDAPDAWWAWVCAWAGWSLEDWRRFRSAWGASGGEDRENLVQATGIRFLDWRRVPGGSIRGSVDDAFNLLDEHLRELPLGTDLTLVGHSKGGNVVKRFLAHIADMHRADDRQAMTSTVTVKGSPEGLAVRAAIICAPVDPLREVACAALGLGIRPVRWRGVPDGVRMATINNWFDPSGGRLRGVPNYQVRLWNDNFVPWPPHGMKSALARRVLADLGAIPHR